MSQATGILAVVEEWQEEQKKLAKERGPLTYEMLKEVIEEQQKEKKDTRLRMSGNFLDHCPEEYFVSFYNSENYIWTSVGQEVYNTIKDRYERLIEKK